MNEQQFLKCINNPNRREILKCLDNKEKCVNEIIAITNLEQTLVSFHLKSLRKCGLVKSRRDGKMIMYKINHPGILDILKLTSKISMEIKQLCDCDEC